MLRGGKEADLKEDLLSVHLYQTQKLTKLIYGIKIVVALAEDLVAEKQCEGGLWGDSNT